MRDKLLDLPSLWVPDSGVRCGDCGTVTEDMAVTDTKPILFLFLAGAIDVFVTLIVLFLDWGTESTIYYNWITPMWLMCLYMVVVNLVFCLALLHFTNHLSRNTSLFGIKAALVVLSASLYVFGFARLFFGAGTGIVIMMEMMAI